MRVKRPDFIVLFLFLISYINYFFIKKSVIQPVTASLLPEKPPYLKTT